MTPIHDDGQLDAQIKDLLERAVAQTPQPPELETTMLMKSTTPQSRRRNPWIIGGGIGLSAAAALAAFTLLPGFGEETNVLVPATDPAVVDDTVDSTIPQDDAPNVGEDTESADVTPPPTVTQVASQLVLAGESGVQIDDALVTTEPIFRALLGPDGRLWFSDTPDADNTVVALDPATGEREVFDVPLGDAHSLRLADVATVDGELTILYSTNYSQCEGFEDQSCTRTLRTFQPATTTTVTLFDELRFESGWGAIHLADNGVIVATDNNSSAQSIEFFTIGSTTAPTAEALGLEPFYADCIECPNSFSIDQAGQHIAWTEMTVGSDEVTLVIREIATGEQASITTTIPLYNPFGADVQLAGVTFDNGVLTAGQATLSQQTTDAGQLVPLLIDLATGDVTSLEVGTRATLS